MGDEPCDVGPVTEKDQCWAALTKFFRGLQDAGLIGQPMRHHPAGIEPPDERDQRAQRRSAERNLMDFYDNLPTYISACDAMKPADVPHVEAGETFARLIRRG